ncbi:MAG: hypothetical protein V1822_03385 [Candidatus Micrarchaeota archaeon]
MGNEFIRKIKTDKKFLHKKFAPFPGVPKSALNESLNGHSNISKGYTEPQIAATNAENGNSYIEVFNVASASKLLDDFAEYANMQPQLLIEKGHDTLAKALIETYNKSEFSSKDGGIQNALPLISQTFATSSDEDKKSFVDGHQDLFSKISNAVNGVGVAGVQPKDTKTNQTSGTETGTSQTPNESDKKQEDSSDKKTGETTGNGGSGNSGGDGGNGGDSGNPSGANANGKTPRKVPKWAKWVGGIAISAGILFGAYELGLKDYVNPKEKSVSVWHTDSIPSHDSTAIKTPAIISPVGQQVQEADSAKAASEAAKTQFATLEQAKLAAKYHIKKIDENTYQIPYSQVGYETYREGISGAVKYVNGNLKLGRKINEESIKASAQISLKNGHKNINRWNRRDLKTPGTITIKFIESAQKPAKVPTVENTKPAKPKTISHAPKKKVQKAKTTAPEAVSAQTLNCGTILDLLGISQAEQSQITTDSLGNHHIQYGMVDFPDQLADTTITKGLENCNYTIDGRPAFPSLHHYGGTFVPRKAPSVIDYNARDSSEYEQKQKEGAINANKNTKENEDKSGSILRKTMRIKY